MQTYSDITAKAAAAVYDIENVTASVRSVAEKFRSDVPLDDFNNVDYRRLFSIILRGLAPLATQGQKSIANLVINWAGVQAIEAPYHLSNIHGEFKRERLILETPEVVKLVENHYRPNHWPEMQGDQARCLEAESMRTWFFDDATSQLPDSIANKVRSETRAEWWIAFCGPGNSVQIGNPKSLAGRFKSGLHLLSPACEELMIEMFLAL